MKTSIYSQRIELNHWEIIGIESYFASNFNLEGFIYSDKTIHLDCNDLSFGIYKTGKEDLYFTIFHERKENENFRLCLSNNQFIQIDENFEFIKEVGNIFETL